MNQSAPSAEMAAPLMPSPFRLVLTLGLIAMLSGFIIVLVHQVTAEPIARNHRRALEAAIFTVLPGAETRVSFALDGETLQRLDEADIENTELFAGFDGDGQLVGVALQAAARGYAGEIRVLYGFDPAAQAIIGFTVLQSSETPGLGDKIESDPAFLANFEQLEARLDPATGDIANPIVTVKEGEKENPWEIDGISGATVSSEAVGRALRVGTAEWVPRVMRNVEALRSAKTGEGPS